MRTLYSAWKSIYDVKHEMGDFSGLSFDSLVVTIIVITTIIIAVRVSGKMSGSTKKNWDKEEGQCPAQTMFKHSIKET